MRAGFKCEMTATHRIKYFKKDIKRYLIDQVPFAFIYGVIFLCGWLLIFKAMADGAVV